MKVNIYKLLTLKHFQGIILERTKSHLGGSRLKHSYIALDPVFTPTHTSSKTIWLTSHRQEIKVGQNSSISLPCLCLLNNARLFCSRLSCVQILLCLHYYAPHQPAEILVSKLSTTTCFILNIFVSQWHPRGMKLIVAEKTNNLEEWWEYVCLFDRVRDKSNRLMMLPMFSQCLSA